MGGYRTEGGARCLASKCTQIVSTSTYALYVMRLRTGTLTSNPKVEVRRSRYHLSTMKRLYPEEVAPPMEVEGGGP